MSVANTLEAGTAAFVRAIAGSSLTPIDVVRGDVSTMEGRSRLVCRFRLSRTKTVHFEDPIMVKEATPITNEPENMSDDMLGTLNIEELAMALEFAKDQEKQAKNYRLKVEDVILDHPEVIKERKAEGTSNVGRIKIATGYTRGWDQEVLNGKEKRRFAQLLAVRSGLERGQEKIQSAARSLSRDDGFGKRGANPHPQQANDHSQGRVG